MWVSADQVLVLDQVLPEQASALNVCDQSADPDVGAGLGWWGPTLLPAGGSSHQGASRTMMDGCSPCCPNRRLVFAPAANAVTRTALCRRGGREVVVQRGHVDGRGNGRCESAADDLAQVWASAAGTDFGSGSTTRSTPNPTASLLMMTALPRTVSGGCTSCHSSDSRRCPSGRRERPGTDDRRCSSLEGSGRDQVGPWPLPMSARCGSTRWALARGPRRAVLCRRRSWRVGGPAGRRRSERALSTRMSLPT